ncbi:uncharacterized protein B0H64DRAFT_91441 [Chaetomium fimeti]|uniref:Uncharacterized protein n=1 Tax=Chaetomium fimeti TaxID=1854472 RepID=A0AAE0HMV8_9PEZI|nr:hypothetical protein B0H64DRAFT_91441 [Chaetomium fimeti]
MVGGNSSTWLARQPRPKQEFQSYFVLPRRSMANMYSVLWIAFLTIGNLPPKRGRRRKPEWGQLPVSARVHARSDRPPALAFPISLVANCVASVELHFSSRSILHDINPQLSRQAQRRCGLGGSGAARHAQERSCEPVTPYFHGARSSSATWRWEKVGTWGRFEKKGAGGAVSMLAVSKHQGGGQGAGQSVCGWRGGATKAGTLPGPGIWNNCRCCAALRCTARAPVRHPCSRLPSSRLGLRRQGNGPGPSRITAPGLPASLTRGKPMACRREFHPRLA